MSFASFFSQRLSNLFKGRPIKSRPHTFLMHGSLKVITIPVLRDNYMYLMIDTNSNKCAAIDCGSAEEAIVILDEEGLELDCVLSTHHHWDHAAGNKMLMRRYQGLTIYGGDERIPYVNYLVNDGDTIDFGPTQIQCILTPSHTTGHMCFYVKPQRKSSGILFSGDSLLVGGCGRFFESKTAETYDSLLNRLGSLPDSTFLYCGHEYTLYNLKFAGQVEPENNEIFSKFKWAMSKHIEKEPTVPSTIGDEKKTNPFMRVDEPSLRHILKASSGIHAMKKLRRLNKKF